MRPALDRVEISDASSEIHHFKVHQKLNTHSRVRVSDITWVQLPTKQAIRYDSLVENESVSHS